MEQFSHQPTPPHTETDMPVDHTNRHFKGQQRAEELICFSRKHPIVLLRPFVLTQSILTVLLLGIAILVTLPVFKESWILQMLLTIMLALLALTHHAFFLRLFRYHLEIFILTTYRVIDLGKSVFIHDTKEMIDLHEIQDIKKNQDGIWANLLNYGDITVTTASMTISLALRDLPNPDYYLDQINQGKRRYIIDRRVQKGLEKQPKPVTPDPYTTLPPKPIAPEPYSHPAA